MASTLLTTASLLTRSPTVRTERMLSSKRSDEQDPELSEFYRACSAAADVCRWSRLGSDQPEEICKVIF